MQRKQSLGSLVLALGLLSGQALASGMEPTPEKELEFIPIKDAEFVPASLDLVFQDSEPDTEDTPEEGFLPELPILLDGKLYSAEELQNAEVYLTHYVLDSRSAELNVIQGFRSSEDLKRYLDETGQYPQEGATPENPEVCFAYSQFFVEPGFGGDYFSVCAGQAHPFLGSWDNSISSVSSSRFVSWTVLFDQPNFKGQKLLISRGWSIPRLSEKGWLARSAFWPVWFTWNNRASSVSVLR